MFMQRVCSCKLCFSHSVHFWVNKRKRAEFDSFKESRLKYRTLKYSNNSFYMRKNMGKARLNLIIKGITLLNLF